MKKTIILSILFFVMALSGCGILGGNRTSDTAKFESVQQLSSFLEDKEWTFVLNRVVGHRVPSTFNGYGYTMTISGDEIKCHLPFFGRAYRTTIGGGNPMDFVGKIKSYNVVIKDEGREEVQIDIIAITDGQNEVRFSCSAYPTGYVHIMMLSTDTEGITYMGYLHRKAL